LVKKYCNSSAKASFQYKAIFGDKVPVIENRGELSYKFYYSLYP